jgi:hypothetical protein
MYLLDFRNLTEKGFFRYTDNGRPIKLFTLDISEIDSLRAVEREGLARVPSIYAVK